MLGLAAVNTPPDERGGDADQDEFRHGIARHATLAARDAGTASYAVAHRATYQAGASAFKEVVEEFRVLAVRAGRHASQQLRVLETVLYCALTRKAETLLIRLVSELPAEFRTLLGHHSRKRLQSRTLIVFFRKPNNDLAVAVQSLFVRDVIVRRCALIVTLHEIPVLIEGTHASPSLRLPRQIF